MKRFLTLILSLCCLLAPSAMGATANFNLPNAAMLLSGVAFQNASTTHMDGLGTQYDTIITGTAATMLVSSEGGAAITCSVTVDGSTSTVNIPGSSYSSVTLFTGLTDAAHTVTIKSTGSSATSIAWNNTNALSVTGAAPAIAAPTTVFPQTRLNAMGNAAVPSGKLILTTGGGASYGYFDGTYAQTTFNDQGTWFLATGGALNCFCLQNGFQYRVSVDGVDGALQTAPNTSTFGWTSMATGLDATKQHLYSIQVTASPNGVTSLYSINMGSGGTVNTSYSFTGSQNLPVIAVMGDSIAAGSTLTDTGLAFPHLLALHFKAALYNAGIPSSTVGSGGASPEKTRSSDMTGGSWPYPPQIILNEGATNDASGGSATLQADYLAMLQAQRSAYPYAKIYCLNIFPRQSMTPAVLAPYRANIAAAVASMNDNAIVLVDVTGWNLDGASHSDYTTNYAADALHLNAAGHLIVYNKLLPTIQAALSSGGSSGFFLSDNGFVIHQ